MTDDVLIRRPWGHMSQRNTDIERGKGHVNTKAEIGKLQLQAKEHQRLPWAMRS